MQFYFFNITDFPKRQCRNSETDNLLENGMVSEYYILFIIFNKLITKFTFAYGIRLNLGKHKLNVAIKKSDEAEYKMKPR